MIKILRIEETEDLEGWTKMTLNSSAKTNTNEYTLEVAVGKDIFQEAIQKSFHKNRSKITIPGFRRGKASKGMIERYYGENVFYEDAVTFSYPDAYDEAVKEAGIRPVDRPDIEIQEIDSGGYTFKAVVTVYPEVKLGEYKKLSADKILYQAREEEIDAQLAQMQERGSRMVQIEDRPARNGDQVVIDFEGFVDDKAFEGGKGEGYPLTLGSGTFIPGFEEQILGKQIGEEFDVDVTFPEDYNAEELKGQKAIFKCKLHEIKVKELPELDDEFAKDVSEFDTLKELRADLKAKLQEQKDGQSTGELENSLMEQVVDGMECEVPQVMIESRIDEMVQDFDARLQAQGMNLQMYMQYTGGTLEEFRKTFQEQAERWVKSRVALDKIVEIEGIKPSAEDIDAEYKRLAEQYSMEEEQVKKLLSEDQLVADLSAQKALDLIRESAVVTEKVEEKSEAEEEKATQKAATRKSVAEKGGKPSTSKTSAEKVDAGNEEKPAKRAAVKKATSKKTGAATEEKPKTTRKTTVKKVAPKATTAEEKTEA